MMNPFSWLQMTNMISYQGLVRTFLSIQGYELSASHGRWEFNCQAECDATDPSLLSYQPHLGSYNQVCYRTKNGN
ncbi:hypothetical protein, partial [Aeromonas veronii]|uniref:hypothetical protein n=1 Tax=Aeromonas veronii TaxID=654 RepID=UPI003D1AD422